MRGACALRVVRWGVLGVCRLCAAQLCWPATRAACTQQITPGRASGHPRRSGTGAAGGGKGGTCREAGGARLRGAGGCACLHGATSQHAPPGTAQAAQPHLSSASQPAPACLPLTAAACAARAAWRSWRAGCPGGHRGSCPTLPALAGLRSKGLGAWGWAPSECMASKGAGCAAVPRASGLPRQRSRAAARLQHSSSACWLPCRQQRGAGAGARVLVCVRARVRAPARGCSGPVRVRGRACSHRAPSGVREVVKCSALAMALAVLPTVWRAATDRNAHTHQPAAQQHAAPLHPASSPIQHHRAVRGLARAAAAAPACPKARAPPHPPRQPLAVPPSMAQHGTASSSVPAVPLRWPASHGSHQPGAAAALACARPACSLACSPYGGAHALVPHDCRSCWPC